MVLASGKIKRWPARPPCRHCAQCRHCLPGIEPDDSLNGVERLIKGELYLKSGQHLYSEYDPISGIFAIRSGFCKSYRYTADGSEQVLAFHFPGDFIGFDALAHGHHQVSAQTLDSAVLCQFDPVGIEDPTVQPAGLHQRLLRIMSRELALVRGHDLGGPADARTAHFLVHLSERLGECGFDGADFRLPMPRRDMASYLRIAPETISRTLHKLTETGMVRLRGRRVEILDRLGLQALSERIH